MLLDLHTLREIPSPFSDHIECTILQKEFMGQRILYHYDLRFITGHSRKKRVVLKFTIDQKRKFQPPWRPKFAKSTNLSAIMVQYMGMAIPIGLHPSPASDSFMKYLLSCTLSLAQQLSVIQSYLLWCIGLKRLGRDWIVQGSGLCLVRYRGSAYKPCY